MKNLKMLVWLTQLGLSVALPPFGFIYLAIRLRERYSWGNWVVWVAVVLGVIFAIEGLRSSLKAMLQMNKNEKEQNVPVSFNEHD